MCVAEERHGAGRQDDTDNGRDLPPNVRAIVRVGSEFFLRSIDAMAALQDDDLVLALVFNALWMANVRALQNSPANLEYGGIGSLAPDAVREPVSILAIANSLRLPYETVRRHVHLLVRRKECIRVSRQGFIVPAAVHGQSANRTAVQATLSSLLRLFADLKRAGFDFAPYRLPTANTVALPRTGAAPPNMRALLRVGMEIVLRGIDLMGRMLGGDLLAGLIFTAIWTSNVRHITGSGESLRFGGLSDLPPDELRRPVAVNAIAAALCVPYETARRYTNRLVREGFAVRVSGKGLIVPRKQLALAETYDTLRLSYDCIVDMVAGMHRAGFDFSNY